MFRCSVRKGVLRNFAKFTGKHLCQGLRPATLLKTRLWRRCFPVDFGKFLRTTFLEKTSWRLLLKHGTQMNKNSKSDEKDCRKTTE